jgi:hypothetical protein
MLETHTHTHTPHPPKKGLLDGTCFLSLSLFLSLSHTHIHTCTNKCLLDDYHTINLPTPPIISLSLFFSLSLTPIPPTCTQKGLLDDSISLSLSLFHSLAHLNIHTHTYIHTCTKKASWTTTSDKPS